MFPNLENEDNKLGNTLYGGEENKNDPTKKFLLENNKSTTNKETLTKPNITTGINAFLLQANRKN